MGWGEVFSRTNHTTCSSDLLEATERTRAFVVLVGAVGTNGETGCSGEPVQFGPWQERSGSGVVGTVSGNCFGVVKTIA